MNTDYYTVSGRVVYRIGNNDELQPSGDTLFTINTDCTEIGKFVRGIYVSKSIEVTAKQAIRRFK